VIITVHNIEIPKILYSYREQTRRPFVIFAFVLNIVMLAVAFVYGAPWYFFIPLLICFAMLCWMVIVNRVSGAELNLKNLTVYSGTWHKSFEVRNIAGLRLQQWSESAPTVSITLLDGTYQKLPGQCVGSSQSLADAIAKIGIQVMRK
jgi:hypothetical protein